MSLADVVIADLMHPTVLAAATTGVLALAGVSMSRSRTEAKRTRKAVEETKFAITNDHPVHIRTDLDDIAAGIKAVAQAVERQEAALRDTRNSLGGLRDDMRIERQDRMADIAALRDVLRHLAGKVVG